MMILLVYIMIVSLNTLERYRSRSLPTNSNANFDMEGSTPNDVLIIHIIGVG